MRDGLALAASAAGERSQFVELKMVKQEQGQRASRWSRWTFLSRATPSGQVEARKDLHHWSQPSRERYRVSFKGIPKPRESAERLCVSINAARCHSSNGACLSYILSSVLATILGL